MPFHRVGIFGRCALVVPLLLVLSACYQRMTVTEVESMLSERLKAGDSERRVMFVLDSLGIERSSMGRDSTIAAIIRKTARSPLVTTDIAITLSFDHRPALSRFKVREVHTGL
jgi:hypothetical protein